MENTEWHSTFELLNNIEFEEKVDIEDLVSHSEPTGTPWARATKNIKKPKNQMRESCRIA